MATAASQRGTLAALAVSRDPSDSGVYQTSPGLLRRVALAQWAEGLAQYIAIRVGDARRGRLAYGSLARMVKNLPPDELLEAPGPKAQLYRLARSVAEVERAMPGLPDDEGLPWREPSGTPAQALAQLRTALGAEPAELLELRHARELSLEEIACVLELPEDEVELRLDTAEACARRLLGARAPDPLAARASLYVEAFALARSWREEGEDDEDPLAFEISDGPEGLSAGTLIGGRYQIVDRVGTGAFGDVYRAEDVEVPGHQVALKVLRQPSLSESARQSALRELKLNAAVFHPSLVQFKDHGWYEERLWFVMPWYEGETLEQRIRRGGLTRAEARRIFEPLARALAALHEAGIRHQDIKPDNVLLTRLPGYGLQDEVLPVLIDLGVAAEEQETMLGGTPLYFAPEVAGRFIGEGDRVRDVDRAADVFALALSLRNALEPGTQDDVPAGAIQAFIERRAHEAPPMPGARDLRYLCPTLERWLSLDPLERPSAEELAEELSVLTMPEERRERRWRLVRLLVPLLVTLAAAFSLVVYALDQRASREERAAERARMEAADVRANLIVENARRAALEEGHAELLDRYAQSRLTRHQLADELATVEGQLRIVRGELSSALEQRAALRERLTETRTRLDTTEAALTARAAELAQRTAELAQTSARATALGRELEAAEQRVGALRSELGRATEERDLARRQLTAATQDLAAARASEQRERDRSDALSAELTEARASRASAETELGRLRARIDSLASSLATAPATPETPIAAPRE